MTRNHIRVGLVLLSATLSHAASYTWDSGTGNGDWTNAVNWVGDAVTFNTGDDFVIPATATPVVQNLSGLDRNMRGVDFQGAGFTLTNGRIKPAGAGNAADGLPLARIQSSGTNTIATDIYDGGNSPCILSHAGVLTLSGTVQVKGLTLGGSSGIVATKALLNTGSNRQFQKTGAGTAWLQAGMGSDWQTVTLPQVSSGTLIANGTVKTTTWNVRKGTGTYDTVTPTLGGTATFGVQGSPATKVNVTIGGAAVGRLAPGDPASNGGIGTLTVVGNVTIGNGGTLVVQLAEDGSCDLLRVNTTGESADLRGNLTLAGTDDVLDIAPPSSAVLPGTYVLAQYAGALTGTFATVTRNGLALPTAWSISYGSGSNSSITLTVATASGTVVTVR